MLSDFQLLGIEETHDILEIKRAFRKRIKDIHPDHSTEENSFKNHLLFIQINHAYKRLLDSSIHIPREAPRYEEMHSSHQSNSVMKSKDPAYAFYKAAMNYFMQIHPSKWNNEIQIQAAVNENDKPEQEFLKQTALDLYRLFPKAYYYFSIVVHEYPESMWKPDAQDKMTTIEKLTKMYSKIITSFGKYEYYQKSNSPAKIKPLFTETP